MRLRWKVCGITRTRDGLRAAELGADAVGFVFYRPSPRWVEPAAAAEIAGALPEGVLRVGVFVDEARERIESITGRVGLDLIQLSGDEDPGLCGDLSRPVLKALRLNEGFEPEAAESAAAAYRECTILLDGGGAGRYGGTGETADWEVAAHLARRREILLAGGLTPENVSAAVATVRPWGVDVSSGVEAEPGHKDPQLLSDFSRALEPYR